MEKIVQNIFQRKKNPWNNYLSFKKKHTNSFIKITILSICYPPDRSCRSQKLSPFVNIIIGCGLKPPATSCKVNFATNHNFTVFLFQEKKSQV